MLGCCRMTMTNNYTICVLIHSHIHHVEQTGSIYTTPLTFTQKRLLLFSNYSQFFTVDIILIIISGLLVTKLLSLKGGVFECTVQNNLMWARLLSYMWAMASKNYIWEWGLSHGVPYSRNFWRALNLAISAKTPYFLIWWVLNQAIRDFDPQMWRHCYDVSQALWLIVL